MFYSEYVLAKKGALGKVWLAAHWEKKLSRNQMARSNIVECCATIMKPAAPLALRTSGHLLLGVVRIHDGKQQSLMHDCSHALVQIKLAFRPGNVDLPAKGSTNLAAITMTETFADFDMEMEEPLAGNGDMAEANMTMNIGTAEEITMPEANISTIEVAAPEMDGFGEDAFGNVEPVPFLDAEDRSGIEVGRDADLEEQSFQVDMSDIGGGGKQAATKDQTLDETTDLQLADVSEIPLEQSNLEMGEDDFGNVSGIPPEFQMDGDLSMIEGGVAADADEANRTNDADADAFAMDQTIGNDTTILDEQPEDVSLAKGEGEDAEQQEIGFGEIAAIAPEADTGTTRREKAKGRKRRMVIDVNLEIPSAEMRRGLEPHGPDDISRRPYRKKRGAFDFDRLPLTGKMHDYLLQDNSAEAMFTRSNIPGLCPKLDRMFTRFMVTTPRPSLDQDDINEVEFEQPDLQNETKEHVDDIEVGRREPASHDQSDLGAFGDAADQTNDVSIVDQSALDFVPEMIPDETRFEGDMDNTTMNESKMLDDTGLMGHNDSVEASILDFTNASQADVTQDGGEQLVTSEEYEQGHLTVRTQKMMTSLRTGFETKESLSYEGMTAGKDRRAAAACLFEILVLKTKDYIEVQQDEPYADITVTPTDLLLAEE